MLLLPAAFDMYDSQVKLIQVAEQVAGTPNVPSNFVNFDWFTLLLAVMTALMALAMLIGIIWAIALYRRGQRRQAAKWVHDIFQRFELGSEFDRAKLMVEFQYQELVEPIIAARGAVGTAALDSSRRTDCQHIDRLLHYLEHLLYLADHSHVNWNDCMAYFQKWFDLLSHPERGALRRYLVAAGYERLTKFARVSADDYVLLYGSVGSREPMHAELGLDKALQRLGPREVNGSLYDLGEYPGLVLGPGGIVAELFKVQDPSVFKRLDEFEEYNPAQPDRSLYRRTTRQLPKHGWRFVNKLRGNPMIDPWIYVYNQPIDGKVKITTSSWSEHKRTRQQPEFPPSDV